MGILSALFGSEHAIVGRARRSESISIEVWAAYVREGRDGYSVGVRHGNDRLTSLETYTDAEDANEAAAALADHYGVGVES